MGADSISGGRRLKIRSERRGGFILEMGDEQPAKEPEKWQPGRKEENLENGDAR